MENGATIMLESSWALNTLDIDEAKTSLCGTKAGADMKNGLRLNGIRFNRPYIDEIDVSPTGVPFYSSTVDEEDKVMEARTFYNAIMHGGSLIVKPEQAFVVTQILEAIYESAKTGKTIEF
jgi:predicted dehydrogenase